MDRGAWHGFARVGHDLATKPPPPDTLKGFPGGSVIKNPPANAGDAGDTGLIAGSGRCPWKRKRQSTPVFLLEKSHGQRSLVGCSLWGLKGSGMTEHKHTHTHTHTHTQSYFKNVFLKSGLLMCGIQSLWNISCGHRKMRCMRWASMGIQIAYRGGFL